MSGKGHAARPRATDEAEREYCHQAVQSTRFSSINTRPTVEWLMRERALAREQGNRAAHEWNRKIEQELRAEFAALRAEHEQHRAREQELESAATATLQALLDARSEAYEQLKAAAQAVVKHASGLECPLITCRACRAFETLEKLAKP